VSPVAVYVSGGLDSSAVLCVSAAQLSDPKTLCSVSATFPGLACDESAHIAAANSMAGTTAHLFPFSPPHGASYVQQVWRFSDVCDSPNAAPLNALRGFARRSGIRVALTGHGADESFGRNPYYYRELLRLHSFGTLFVEVVDDVRRNRVPLSVLRRLIGAGFHQYASKGVRRAWARAKHGGQRVAFSDQQALSPGRFQQESLLDRLRTSRRCRRLEVPAHAYRHSLSPVAESVAGTEIDNRTASTFGLEERDPFQDRQVLEFASALPESQLSRGPGKYVVRESLRGVLPEGIRLRTDKAEFSETLAIALLDDTVAGTLACPHLVALGYVEKQRISGSYSSFLASYRGGNPSYINHIWGLWMAFVLETWVNMMETRSAAQPTAGRVSA
jgi:asparagine synthase (glutamine-hydrolysing)